MASSVNGRDLALQTLLTITRDGEYSHIALKKILDEHQYLDKKERAFITRLVNGTLERMIEIDYILNLFSKTKVKRSLFTGPRYCCKFPELPQGSFILVFQYKVKESQVLWFKPSVK